MDESPKDYYEAVKDQLEVTLVPLGSTSLKEYFGKKVTVQGKLFHAETGHHHTAVLIEIGRIAEFNN